MLKDLVTPVGTLKSGDYIPIEQLLSDVYGQKNAHCIILQK